MQQQTRRTVKKIIPLLAVSLAGCTAAYPPRDTSTINKINDQLKQAASPHEQPATPPDSVSSSLLPPLGMPIPRASSKQLEERFDLVVSDAPINQVLTGLVSGTRYSILLKPKSPMPPMPGAAAAPVAVPAEKVTVNLKDVTVFEALDAIREIYGYDYTVEGNRIYVQPPELQTRLYQVNYILGQRRGVSDLQVIGGASVGGSSSSSGSSGGGSSSGGSGSGSSSNYASVQASALSTIAKSDLWGEVEDTLRTTLGCQIPHTVPKTTGGGGGSGGTSGSSSSSNNSSGASRADVSFQGDTQNSERPRGVDGCTDGRAMTINQMSGTILVRGMPTELRTIEKMLRTMQLNIERQVIIEAKIIDVALNAESQQGINWSAFNASNQHRFSVGANLNNISARPSIVTFPTSSTTSNFTSGTPGTTTTSISTDATGATTTSTSITSGTAPTLTTNTSSTAGTSLLGGLVSGSLGGLLSNGAVGANTLASGLGVAVQYQSVLALIDFLQTQGSVHVLSSPRIATLNNQKAVLKVGSEEPFVTNIIGGSTNITNGIAQTTQPTLQYQPFFSGIALDVTPQIDDKGNITLHVHAMVNSIIEKGKISQPTATAVSVPFAVNTINETDNVVKAKDGQVIVIGGLMTENSMDGRSKVPGVGDIPGAGALFRNGAQSKSKRELVILLKTTVVKDDSAWTNDVTGVQGRIEGLSGK